MKALINDVSDKWVKVDEYLGTITPRHHEYIDDELFVVKIDGEIKLVETVEWEEEE